MAYVVRKLKLGWSPELISGRWSNEHPSISISHEAIYQFIYNKKQHKEEDLTVYLPRFHRKRLPRGHSRKHRKSHIPQRIFIEQRPQYIERRRQPGHWESDTIVSRQRLAAGAGILGRTSRGNHLKKNKKINRKTQTTRPLGKRYNRVASKSCGGSRYVGTHQ